ncbi:LAMI_0E04060g1_1 [Lachancea mirantina]|uniref:LAMI_0E04060g1_1 n=1 Tax=Lachancea mirantina TaxID=1230905 RepID=A0A1G4JK49_9SACH|nr:LAMI_0E04060g1_1 [Lachancea mirantina]
MARKLKGKKGMKGLKAALSRQQADVKSKEKLKKKISHTQNKGQLTKDVVRNQQRQREQAQNVLPFEKESTLMLIGEGDFSYACSIVKQGLILPENLIVTSYDNSPSELQLKYPHSFGPNYNILMENQVKVFFKTDATMLVKSLKITKKSPWTKLLGPEWRNKRLQNIMFNFPHTGRGIKDQDRNIAEHQALVLGFFQSSQDLFGLANSVNETNLAQDYSIFKDDMGATTQEENKCRVILSVFTGEPYDSWQIKMLAKKSGWKVERSSQFWWDQYPDYHHRRTNSEQDTTKPASERSARVYIFERWGDSRKAAKEANEKGNYASE